MYDDEGMPQNTPLLCYIAFHHRRVRPTSCFISQNEHCRYRWGRVTQPNAKLSHPEESMRSVLCTRYIQAIEKRLHQVESVLGTIIGSTDYRARELIADLRMDDLAGKIISRVDSGPFGPTGRLAMNAGLTQEGFLKAVFGNAEQQGSQNARTSRESRLVREGISSSQETLDTPTLEWQDKLLDQLRRRRSSFFSPMSTSPDEGTSGTPDFLSSRYASDVENFPAAFRSHGQVESGLAGLPLSQLDFRGLFAGENSSSEEFAVSGTPNRDEASELPFLRLVSGSDIQNEPTLWRLPLNTTTLYTEPQPIDDIHDVELPSLDLQDVLISIYFTYVHPVLPVIHKPSFDRDYRASRTASQTAGSNYGLAHPTASRPSPEHMKSFNLVLFAMFSVAIRYINERSPATSGRPSWDFKTSNDFLTSARRILNAFNHRSSIVNCQALLILAYQEAGIGMTDQGWLFLGMAIRMAQDLGLNQAADNWKQAGRDLFTSDEKQERKQLWWACVTADKYMSVFPGRPVAIRESDFDTELPQEQEMDELELWIPHPAVQAGFTSPLSAHAMSCFKAAATLSLIQGRIVERLYAVRRLPDAMQGQLAEELEKHLDHWYQTLPSHLHYDSLNTNLIYPPHVLTLHIQYWCAVILLHRKFIQGYRGTGDPLPSSVRNFHSCQEAAQRVSDIVSTFSRVFGLSSTCAFMPSYLFSVGVIYIAILSMIPGDRQAEDGVQKMLGALEEIQVLWPSAARCRELLRIAKARLG
ncbi:hypothetical protein BD410DRAFT_562461 [Rickenella mellea]|uniref:Xylanolytic transcriptional activator regulatory domain-containing protein n=1 Tax=Rickenella mellea TaxID=50990 RepID=A0A4Y7QEC2_9AGAM|nr:hypothetical protein BD410DRAFT_562461 [Rickenella mellea]